LIIMEFENLLTLIKTVSDSELTDFDYEENGTRIRLKKKKETVVVSGASSNVPVMGLENIRTVENVAAVNTANTQADNSEPEGMIVKSPLVGTFYAAPAEDADPFVSVGDQVKKGQTLAIVEAMKLMNEIESDFDGKVAEIYVENGQAVEYGQPLFRIV
jgi:acetyl-CoA carboxylase biotin carboxyl carrier protein